MAGGEPNELLEQLVARDSKDFESFKGAVIARLEVHASGLPKLSPDVDKDGDSAHASCLPSLAGVLKSSITESTRETCVGNESKDFIKDDRSVSERAEEGDAGDSVAGLASSISVVSEVIDLCAELVTEYAEPEVVVDAEHADPREYTELPDTELVKQCALG